MLFFSQFSWIFEGGRGASLLTGIKGMEGVGVDTNHTIARKPGPLYIIRYSLVTYLLGRGL
jgi:hypothetical protein